MPITVNMVLTDKLSSGPGTCCSNVAVNGRGGFSAGFAVGDQAQAGQTIDHQIVRNVPLLWQIGTPQDVGAILSYDANSSPGINSPLGGSQVDLADVTFTLSLPSGVGLIAASGHDYTAAVPEPASGVLMALGLARLLAARRAAAPRVDTVVAAAEPRLRGWR